MNKFNLNIFGIVSKLEVRTKTLITLFFQLEEQIGEWEKYLGS